MRPYQKQQLYINGLNGQIKHDICLLEPCTTRKAMQQALHIEKQNTTKSFIQGETIELNDKNVINPIHKNMDKSFNLKQIKEKKVYVKI